MSRLLRPGMSATPGDRGVYSVALKHRLHCDDAPRGTGPVNVLAFRRTPATPSTPRTPAAAFRTGVAPPARGQSRAGSNPSSAHHQRVAPRLRPVPFQGPPHAVHTGIEDRGEASPAQPALAIGPGAAQPAEWVQSSLTGLAKAIHVLGRWLSSSRQGREDAVPSASRRRPVRPSLWPPRSAPAPWHVR